MYEMMEGVKSIGVYDEIILYGYMIEKWIHFVCLFYVHFVNLCVYFSWVVSYCRL